MDIYSHRVANRMVGNEDDAAALEITLVGPELKATGDLVCAVAGAIFELSIDGAPVEINRPFHLRHGASLHFGQRVAGARASLAIRGGIDVSPVFGSRSTSLAARLGPFDGRALVAGNVLPAGLAEPRTDGVSAPHRLALPRGGGTRLRAIAGPHEAMFTADAMELFFSARFSVMPSSNRMGYRLAGPALAYATATDILSDATPIGSVQVPRSGQPILLMADRQTTGGYPKIATIITADLPLAGQVAPGDWIRFVRCTRTEAIDALQRLERRLSGRPS